MQAKKVGAVEQALTRMITRHPFYASILLKRELKQAGPPWCKTACVTPRGQIYYNPKWFDTLTVEEIVFVLAHECMHYMFMHHLRRGARNPKKWNIAGDAVINETLKACGVGSMPEDGIKMLGADHMNTEEVYSIMPDEQQGQSGQPDSGSDDGWGIGDDLADEGERLSEADISEIEAEVHVDIREAVQSAKRMGRLPAALDRIVTTLLEVKTPWHEKLLQFMSRASDTDYSYSAMDRRFIHAGMRLPWFDGYGLAKVVIIIDVSGSISDQELEHFSGHLNTVLDTCTPQEVYVAFVHTEVVKVEQYTPDDFPVTLKCSESGGTDMTAGIDWAADTHPDADAIIVLTDGFTPFGNDCGIPTFWAITTNRVSPWGETVQLEVD